MRFDRFSLDAKRHVLMRDDEEIALSPHLVDILHHLAARPGELVTKDSLLDQFWPEVNVTENTLTRAIADIRKALGDDATSPRYIQTVARRGYRFVGTIAAEADSHDAFRQVVRGRAALEALDVARLPEAIRAFEQAVLVMPDYAPAHAGLANACLLQFEASRVQNIPERQQLECAITHARRACALDATLGEAWATLGFALAAAGEMEEARAVTRRASAIEPSSWRHHFRLSLASWGEERLRAAERTLALLPDFAPARFVAAMVYIARQAYAPALEAAARGAAQQSRQPAQPGLPFPAIGLHWLSGLLLLREHRIAEAIQCFAREIDELHDTQIYAAEFRVNAQIGAGFAHLAVRDRAGAVDTFRLALETVPRNGRALLGMYLALQQTSLAHEAAALLPEVERAIEELNTGKRPIEAAFIRAALATARGAPDQACDILRRLLEVAPPGQAGWLIPIDPLLAALRSHDRFPQVLALLAARAA